jgi:NAD-dependent SIR2 family protein deacetylase
VVLTGRVNRLETVQQPDRTLTSGSVLSLVDDKNQLPQIGTDDFVRRFSMRAAGLMWLLGAGASASAGIPTAWDMIWEFKQQLFISQRRVSPQAVADLTNPVIRAQLQAHIDSLGNLPAPGAPYEYAALFEAVYPSEIDRRAYLDAKMAGAKPSYGHLALATLMRASLTRLVWTTNFDPLVADACAKVFDGTGALTMVALDAPNLAAHSIAEERWPIEVKLHGDFRSRRLKNTGDELRHQDKRLRQLLVDSCRRFGLVVVGYSGRDDSIMDTLEEALEHRNAFPAGLFWLLRGDDQPLPRVQQLLMRAQRAGVEAALVRVQNFDEAMRDLLRLVKGIDTTIVDRFATERRRWSSAPRPQGNRGWPVVRLNGLPLDRIPRVCRRVVCGVRGYAEVREAVEMVGVDLIFTSARGSVLAYGADPDVRNAFEAYGITEFDLHTIDDKRLRYESAERGLLNDALNRALARARGLDVIRRRNTNLLAPLNANDNVWASLRKLVGTLDGTVNGYPELHWREGIETRLDWAGNRLWLLVDPCTIFTGVTDDNKAAAADFARERTVKRYNRELNALIDFWVGLLAGDGSDLRALGIGDGVDAVFTLSRTTAFSRRSGV